MNLAKEISLQSKDPHTKVGAVIMKNGMVLSTGYNDFPNNCKDYSWDKQEKQLYVLHAEMNAILRADRFQMQGADIYTTRFPCNRCTQLIIEAGIRRVFFNSIKKEETPEVQASKRMLNDAGIIVRHCSSS